MAAAQDRFTTIWGAALDEYQRSSGLTLQQIPEPKDIETFKQQIEESESHFEDFQQVWTKLWDSLSTIMGSVEILGRAVAEGTSSMFPAAPVIMGALSILIKGATGVSRSYDYIQDMADDMRMILARLQIHTTKSIPPELRIIFVEILCCTLEILGLSAKFIADGRAKRYIRETIQPNSDRVSDLRDKLIKLVEQETAMAGALNLDITTDALTHTTTAEIISNSIDLKVAGYAESIQKLSVSTGGPPVVDPAVIIDINFVVPFQLQYPQIYTFTGREEQISTIHKYFKEQKHTVVSRVFVLIGIGGIGKTQIALEYAYREQSNYSAIFWLSAASENTIRASFVEILQRIIEAQVQKISWPQSGPNYAIIASKLGMSGLVDDSGIVDPQNPEVIKSALFQWLQLPGNGQWLLIFDNADDSEAFDIQEYLPSNGNGAVLITSRRPEFSFTGEKIDVEGLNQKDAVDLLLRLARTKHISQNLKGEAAVLVEKLVLLPLAISQAGCYIRESNSSVGEYLYSYEKMFMEMQSKKPKVGWDYRNDTVATTWEISLSAIKKRDAFSIHPVVHLWARERLDDSEKLCAMASAVLLISNATTMDKISSIHPEYDLKAERALISHARYLDQYLRPRLSEIIPYLDPEVKHGYPLGPAVANALANLGEFVSGKNNLNVPLEYLQESLRGFDK
ncbi:hypothetical protein ABW20_dc0101966 [Dactylellina cionopaga]|nr:hypothetical protein ABW20_dc0101966 [Dactylellina cionopaga]